MVLMDWSHRTFTRLWSRAHSKGNFYDKLATVLEYAVARCYNMDTINPSLTEDWASNNQTFSESDQVFPGPRYSWAPIYGPGFKLDFCLLVLHTSVQPTQRNFCKSSPKLNTVSTFCEEQNNLVKFASQRSIIELNTCLLKKYKHTSGENTFNHRSSHPILMQGVFFDWCPPNNLTC